MCYRHTNDYLAVKNMLPQGWTLKTLCKVKEMGHKIYSAGLTFDTSKLGKPIEIEHRLEVNYAKNFGGRDGICLLI